MRAIPLLFLVGCAKAEDTGVTDLSDCSAEPAPSIVEVGWSCDQTKFFFWADIEGYATGGALRIRHQDGQEESHPLAARVVPLAGCNSELSTELNIIDDKEKQSYEPGWSIGYVCDDETDDLLSWHIAVEDASGAEVDCATWGADPESMGPPDCQELGPVE